MTKTILLSVLLAFSCYALRAQDSFFSDRFERSDQAKADQPHWMTPLVTVTPRLEQEFRTDMLIEQMPTGDGLINFDNGKGLALIPYGGTVPTGTYKYGAHGGVITPTIAGGKGWGNFDVRSTFGGGLP
jgi:hypothetical protein